MDFEVLVQITNSGSSGPFSIKPPISDSHLKATIGVKKKIIFIDSYLIWMKNTRIDHFDVDTRCDFHQFSSITDRALFL